VAPVEPTPRFVPPDDQRVVSDPSVETVETVETILEQPPATCEQVAAMQAAFELGNYADDEEQRPQIERYTTACRRQDLQPDELRCLVGAVDLPGMAYCVPHMFPGVRFK